MKGPVRSSDGALLFRSTVVSRGNHFGMVADAEFHRVSQSSPKRTSLICAYNSSIPPLWRSGRGGVQTPNG